MIVQSKDGFRSAEYLLASYDWRHRIRRAAGRLKRRPLFRDLDIEDVEQELCLGIWDRLHGECLTPANGEACFRRALFCTAASLVRSAETSSRRFNRGHASLSTVVLGGDGDCMELHQVVADPRHEDVDLRLDLTDLLGQECVRHFDRAVALGLLSRNRSQVARDLDVPRSTTHESVKRLREVLEPLAPCAATFRRDRVTGDVGDHIDAVPEVPVHGQ
jgi:hypothetical protein